MEKVNSKKDFVNSIGSITVFGKCSEGDFETVASELRKKEINYRKEKEKIAEERRKQELQKKRQEQEDYEFAKLEQEKEYKKDQTNFRPQSLSRGRGYRANDKMTSISPIASGNSPNSSRISRISPTMRGRGRLSREELEKRPSFFSRETEVKHHLSQLCSARHDNRIQRHIWQEEVKEDPEITNQVLFSQNSPEQFMDPFCSPHSSSPSFHSASSLCSNSPVPQPEIQVSQANLPPKEVFSSTSHKENFQSPPKSKSPIIKRRKPLAAKFSNLFLEDEDGKHKEDERFPVMGSSSAPLTPSGSRTTKGYQGTSINNLSASQRIFTNGILKPEELMKSPFPIKSDDNFCLSEEDFPAL